MFSTRLVAFAVLSLVYGCGTSSSGTVSALDAMAGINDIPIATDPAVTSIQDGFPAGAPAHVQ
jgi:hypothetical protein